VVATIEGRVQRNCSNMKNTTCGAFALSVVQAYFDSSSRVCQIIWCAGNPSWSI